MLTVLDAKIIQVALGALENILKVGELFCQNGECKENPYAIAIEECSGMYFSTKVSKLKKILNFFSFKIKHTQVLIKSSTYRVTKISKSTTKHSRSLINTSVMMKSNRISHRMWMKQIHNLDLVHHPTLMDRKMAINLTSRSELILKIIQSNF